MRAVLDLINVLFSPGAVFERVRERPRFFMPALGLAVIAVVVAYVMMPFTHAAMATRMAQVAQQNPQAAAQAERFQSIGLVFAPIAVFIALLLSAAILWLLVMLLAGGEAKFKLLLSVATYAAVPSVLLQVATLAVLYMKGVENVASVQDLRPALGLNLLAPDVGGFAGGVLGGINPFSIWTMVLTAIGVQVTHKTSKGSAYTVAIVAMVLGVLIGALFAALGSRGAS
jgi:hypothetical protein